MDALAKALGFVAPPTPKQKGYKARASRLWRRRNPAKASLYVRDWERRNPERVSWNKYKNDSKKLGRIWALTQEQHDAIIKSPCHYCGFLPKYPKLNGIDRYDNDEDYYIWNCVPSCWLHNRMKGNLHGDIFKDECKKIAKVHSHVPLFL